MRTISKLIIAFGAVASGALPVHATAFTATFECGEQTVAIVNYKGNLEISISMPANFDAGTVNKSVRWDPDKPNDLILDGRACRRMTDEEIEKNHRDE